MTGGTGSGGLCAIVLAGGMGTRLRARVDGVPKPMAPVGGRPFLEHVLHGLADQGVDRVVLATGYLGEQVSRYFGDRHAGLDLDYSVEDEPLGTGGAIRLAVGRAGRVEESFLVLNGDTIVPVDVAAMRARGLVDGLVLTVCPVPDVARFGALEVTAGRVTAVREKGDVGPGLINAGAYLLGAPLVRELARSPRRFSFERDLMVPWVAAHGASYVESPGPFLDIGVPEDYDRAAQVLAASR